MTVKIQQFQLSKNK